MSTIAKQSDSQKLALWMESPETITKFSAALGGWMPGEAFASQLLISLSDDRLAYCTVASKCKAALRCAALGLLPGLGQVALIPRRTKDGKLEIDVMPMWQGLKAVMERNEEVLEITPEVIHVNDQYEVSNGKIRHAYDPFDQNRVFTSLRDVRGAYCRIDYRDGRSPKYHAMHVRDIEKRKKCAQTTQVWDTWLIEMVKKTVIRDVFARRAVPVDPLVGRKMMEIIKADDEAMGHDPARAAYVRPAVTDLSELKEQIKIAEAPPQPQEVASPEPPAPQVEEVEQYDLEEQLQLLGIELKTVRRLKDCDDLRAKYSERFEHPDDLDAIGRLAEGRKDEIRESRQSSKQEGQLFERGPETPF